MFVCKSRYCRFLTNIESSLESSPVLTVLDISSACRYSYLTRSRDIYSSPLSSASVAVPDCLGRCGAPSCADSAGGSTPTPSPTQAPSSSCISDPGVSVARSSSIRSPGEEAPRYLAVLVSGM